MTGSPRTTDKNPGWLKLTARQVNLILELLILVSLATGIASWIVALEWARTLTVIHAVSGFSMLLVAPLKIRGSVATGFRRGRRTRWLSTVFGALTLGAIAFGSAHSTGLWHGVGYFSALWTHLLFGFCSVPLLLWHVWTRPVRPGPTDLNRRALLATGAVGGAAGAVLTAQEIVLRLGGLQAGDRGGTGSHEVARFDPAGMPVVSWIDDKTPTTSLDEWELTIEGQKADIARIAELASPLTAVLDCTGGWLSTQRWDVVPLIDLVPDNLGRSIKVTSSTGYARTFSRSDAAEIFVCTGYGGKPLSRGHGAPLRIVAPGRRGPWWVKWVISIESTDQRAWLQLPFPTT